LVKSVIIIVSAPFGKRDFDRYGIEILLENGFHVEVFNVLPYLYPDIFNKIKLTDPINWEGLHLINSLDDFKTKLNSNNQNKFIYTTLAFNFRTFGLFKLISEYKIPYCVSSINATPLFIVYKSNFAIERYFTKIRIFFSHIIKCFIMSLCGIDRAALVTRLGLLAIIKRPEVSHKTYQLGIHSHDYDIFLKLRGKSRATDKTVVYLDNYLPYHTDSLYSGEKKLITPEAYHNSLNRLFSEIENITGFEVVIAAHPRSEYTNEFNPFGNRKMYKGVTADLVMASELVILNFSTAINFAVMFEKPCLFFTTNELESSYYKDYIMDFTKLFNKVPVNIDQKYELDVNSLLDFSHESYIKYKNAFIKMPGSGDKFAWQLIADQIKSFKF
jgi:hypothetical protein